jgi:hypothetical protein
MGILGVFDNSVCQSSRFTYSWPVDFKTDPYFYLGYFRFGRACKVCKIMVICNAHLNHFTLTYTSR